MPPETSQTLDRGVRVLLAAAADPRGVSVPDLAERLGLNRTVVYRLVATLEEHGLLRRTPDARFTAGMTLMRLGRAIDPVLRGVAAPPLRALADQVGATAHLTVADGDEAVALVVIEPSWTDFHVAYRVGARHRLSEGAAGRAILLARESGGRPAVAYATSVGELQAGAYGVAAPVLGVDGLEASVGLVSLHPLDGAELATRVVTAAQSVSVALA